MKQHASWAKKRKELPILRLSSLSYHVLEDAFSHPAYEAAAAYVLKQAEERGIGMDYQREMRRCLMEGLLRPDWLLSEEECKRRFRAAYKQEEKNYWLCAWQMAKAREKDLS